VGCTGKHRRLAKEIDILGAEFRTKRLAAESPTISEDAAGNPVSKDEAAAEFTAQMTRAMIRRFQAQLFW
jgi:hypothetical protein